MWGEMESALGFGGDGKAQFSAKRRPSQVKFWISRARKYSIIPEIEEVSVYATTLLSWWDSIQPEWRKGDGSRPQAIYVNRDPDKDEDVSDWAELKKSGPNGFFIVMLAFSWWGRSDEKDLREWNLATADLRHCLERMCISSEKRPAPPVGEVSTAEKRR